MFTAAFLLLFVCEKTHGQKTGPLSDPPDWSRLDRYQETITRDEFLRLLNDVFAPNNASAAYIAVLENEALIRREAENTTDLYRLRFASTEKTSPKRWWRKAHELPPAPREGRPLEGIRIALDPGHIGGDFAKIEERWFQIGDAPPVTEGDMVLLVANKIRDRLTALGAIVTYTRITNEPVTSKRPADFLDLAREITGPPPAFPKPAANPAEESASSEPPVDPKATAAEAAALAQHAASVRRQSELLFYRVSEIRERARLINERLRPDLVLCLHFNAEAWGNPDRPTLVDLHHLHLLINGTYSHAELRLDDVRLEMLEKLLGGSHDEELALSESVGLALEKSTKLPAYQYLTPNATAIGETGLIWARNLLANRLFSCPVIFLEPYVMNSRIDYRRVQMGDYEGLREVPGLGPRPSIFEEYAEAVCEGLVEYFKTRRPALPENPKL